MNILISTFFFIPLITRPVGKISDVMGMVQYGLRTRRESATLVHEHSSRSHLIVTLTVNSQAPSFFSMTKASTPTPDQLQGLFSLCVCVFFFFCNNRVPVQDLVTCWIPSWGNFFSRIDYSHCNRIRSSLVYDQFP